MTISVYERNEYGNTVDEPCECDGRVAAGYEKDIETVIDRENARDDINMAKYFDENNGIQSKLKSMKCGVENIRGELFGCIKVELTAPLTESEKDELTEFISGQNSDGWGEGFEQHPISTDEGDIRVSFWHSGDDYSYATKTNSGTTSPTRTEV